MDGRSQTFLVGLRDFFPGGEIAPFPDPEARCRVLLGLPVALDEQRPPGGIEDRQAGCWRVVNGPVRGNQGDHWPLRNNLNKRKNSAETGTVEGEQQHSYSPRQAAL